jgi:hypothetical protein
MHYLPLAPGFFAILVGFFLIVLILRWAAQRIWIVGTVKTNHRAIDEIDAQLRFIRWLR